MTGTIVSAMQMGSDPAGTAATLAAILGCEAAISASGSRLVVFPEALLGGYPKGAGFGTRLGYRLPEGRAAFRAYYEGAIDVPGAETAALAGLAQRTGAVLVIGVIERAGASLYCASLTFDPAAGLVACHRKLMPTAAERLIWAQGDGSTLAVTDTGIGRITSVICWENYMPLLRTALYAKGVDIWCAPTVDDRDAWQATMRHIALEGRCFVIGACQLRAAPQDLGTEADGWALDRPLIRGGSLIVGPLGDVLAGPVFDRAGLVSAAIDRNALAEARYDFDAVGHYARPDIFRLEVDERERRAVTFRRGDDDRDAPG